MKKVTMKIEFVTNIDDDCDWVLESLQENLTEEGELVDNVEIVTVTEL